MSRNGAGSSRGGNNSNSQQAAGREEQQPPSNELTRSGVVRMMRQVLPADAKVSREAKNPTKGCAKEFINAIVDEAVKRSGQDRRAMLSPEDLAFALRSLGLDRYVEPMGIYLRRYREAVSDEEMSKILDQSESGGNNSSS